ncbi:MAG: hypothetical protein AAGC60_24330 [Acidobacteriota bacterium]
MTTPNDAGHAVEESTVVSAADESAKRFAADGALLLVANGLAGLLFLLVHAVLGRWMDGVDYALVVSLLGLLNVLSVGGNALQLAMARATAGRAARTDAWSSLARSGLGRMVRLLPLLLLAWCGVAWLLRPHLAGASATAPFAALVLLGVIAALRLIVPLAQGLLQGLRRFGWIAAAAIGGAVTRLTAAVVVAAASGGVTAVLGAFVAGATATLALSLWPVRDRLRAPSSGATTNDGPDDAAVWRYALRVGAGQIALFTLMNVDLVLAPRLLAGDALAAYGKAAVLARAVIFLPLPVVGAMVPRAAVSARRGLVGAPLLFVLGVGALLALVAATWPTLLLQLLYGAGTEPAAADLLARMVWAVLPLAAIEVALPWLWARGRTGGVISLAVPVSLYVAVLLAGDLVAGDPARLVGAVAAASLGCLLWLVLAARVESRWVGS